MGTVKRQAWVMFLSLVAMAALAVFAGASAANRAGNSDHQKEGSVYSLDDAKTITNFARFDLAEANSQLVANIPRPLLAALAGVSEEALGASGIARIALAPDAETPMLVGTGPILYAVEAGQITIRSDATVRVLADDAMRAQERGLYGDQMTLQVGDRVLVAAGIAHSLHGDGDTPATVLASTILPAVPAAATFSNDGLTPRTQSSAVMLLPGGAGGSPVSRGRA